MFKYWRECLNACGSSVIVILFNTLIMENVVKELFNSSVSNLKINNFRISLFVFSCCATFIQLQ